MRLSSVNYFGALGGSGGTNLLVTPAQHRVADATLGTSTLRTFTNLDLRLFYSGNLSGAALSDAPTIVSVGAQPAGGGVDFTAEVVGDPAAAIHSVWVTYAAGADSWAPLDLEQCVAPLPAACGTEEDSRLWKGRVAVAPAQLEFVVQAANGLGLVSLDDNRGSYYGLAGAATVATTLTLVSPPAGGTFGDKPSITASLTETAGGAAVAGRTVTVAIGGSAQVSTTGADGLVTLDVPLVTAPGSHQMVASFGGDATYLPSSDSEPFVVTKAPASLSAFTQLAVVTGAGATGIVSTLTASVDEKQQPLMQLTVTYPISGPGGTKSFSTITDYLGRATLPPTGLAAGTYTVSASFAGDSTYTAAAMTGRSSSPPSAASSRRSTTRRPSTWSTPGRRSRSSSASAATAGSQSSLPATRRWWPPPAEQDYQPTRSRPPSRPAAAASSTTPPPTATRYTWKTQKGWVGCRQARVAVRRRQPPGRQLQVLVASR